MKNHPGAALPPSNRHKETDIPGLPNSTFSQTVGSVTTTPQGCQWCHKQYASKVSFVLLFRISIIPIIEKSLFRKFIKVAIFFINLNSRYFPVSFSRFPF